MICTYGVEESDVLRDELHEVQNKTNILGLVISPQVDPLFLSIYFHDNTFNVKGQKTKGWKLRGRAQYDVFLLGLPNPCSSLGY